jgi:hypothetical protein
MEFEIQQLVLKDYNVYLKAYAWFLVVKHLHLILL